MAATREEDSSDHGGTQPHPHPHRRPHNFTLEEMQIMRDCRTKATWYRGVPAGLIFTAAGRIAVTAGYFRKYSGAFYAGMFALGFFGGVSSYSETCMQKIMALENSELANILREQRTKAGLPVTDRKPLSEFQGESLLSNENNTGVEDNNDSFESPLNKRLSSSGSKWEEIRKQHRIAQSPPPPPPPPRNEKGISYDELRRRNRSLQGDYNSLTPEEEEELERTKQRSLSAETATFKASSFSNDRSSASDFSNDSKPLRDNHDDEAERQEKPKKWNIDRDRVQRKNQYGDEIL